VANSHDGTMAVNAAATPIRVVYANTLGIAMRQSQHGVAARRTFRFRHTGHLQTFAEAREVLRMTVDYELRAGQKDDRDRRRRASRSSIRRRRMYD
jgi:hypothetical protein